MQRFRDSFGFLDQREKTKINNERESTLSVNNDYINNIENNLMDLPTEGIIKAEGLNWKQLIFELMSHIMPWKGRLALSFCLRLGKPS